MLDLKTFKSALEQLEEERKIPQAKILEAIEQAMAAAYKKDYGKKGQIIRAKFDLETGQTDFYQVKIVVDESVVIMPDENLTPAPARSAGGLSEGEGGEEERVHFNPEHHILLEDARKIKKGAELHDEIIFPLEAKDDYGRIAAQTAKQVIVQKIREAERSSVLDEYGGKEGGATFTWTSAGPPAFCRPKSKFPASIGNAGDASAPISSVWKTRRGASTCAYPAPIQNF